MTSISMQCSKIVRKLNFENINLQTEINYAKFFSKNAIYYVIFYIIIIFLLHKIELISLMNYDKCYTAINKYIIDIIFIYIFSICQSFW